MILPVYLTDFYASALLLEDNSQDVIETTFIKFPYKKSAFEELTKNRLLNLLKKNLKNYPPDDFTLVIISDKEIHNDIKTDIPLGQIKANFPFAEIILDEYTSDPHRSLNDDEMNVYQNFLVYGLDMPEAIKDKVITQSLTAQVQENTRMLIGADEVVFLTHSVDHAHLKKYVEETVNSYADSIRIAGMWKFMFDTTMAMIPLVGGLMAQQADIKAFFEANPLAADAKLIIAPGIENISFQRETDETAENVAFKSGINSLKLGEEEKAKILWEGKKSKFSGEIYGSKLGVFIDTREIDDKTQK